MVTAELAVGLPAVVLVLAVALSGVALGLDQLRCADAARAGARAASRGDPPAEVARLAIRAAPSGSRVSVTGAAEVTVTVSAPPPAVLDRLRIRLWAQGQASCLREQQGAW